MANPEACELYIEQEIETGLEEGKTPYSIGKELSDWIAKLFEVRISPSTLKMRAYRKQDDLGTNVPKESKTPETIENTTPEIIKDRHPQGGGKREGAGRPSKSIERFLNKAKSLARLAEKIKKEPGYEARKQELLKAAAATINVLTETREDVKWV